MRLAIAVAGRKALVDARLVDVDAKERGAIHCRGEGLRPAHSAKAGREHESSRETSAEVLARDRAERLVRTLQDSLRADVNPRASGHLAVHDQAGALQPAEVIPIRPAPHEVAVRDQHTRRPRVRAKDADGLTALYEQRLVVREPFQ